MKIQIFVVEKNNLIWGLEIRDRDYDDLGLAIDLLLKEAFDDLV